MLSLKENISHFCKILIQETNLAFIKHILVLCYSIELSEKLLFLFTTKKQTNLLASKNKIISRLISDLHKLFTPG